MTNLVDIDLGWGATITLPITTVEAIRVPLQKENEGLKNEVARLREAITKVLKSDTGSHNVLRQALAADSAKWLEKP